MVLLYKELLLQTLPELVTDPAKLPTWNFDGSSTGQATSDDSEVVLQYVLFLKNSFLRFFTLDHR